MIDQVTGVILAAGKGDRIRPFSERLPKPILPILNRPVLDYQIQTISRLGIKKVIIVIGNYGFEIVKALGSERHGVEIEYTEQKQTLGIAAAVGTLEPLVEGPFLLSLGDIFFRTRDLEPMCRAVVSGDCDAALAVKRDEPAAISRNFAVDVNEQGWVHRVIEKPAHPQTDLKGCGIYMFTPAIFDAVRRTPRTAMRDEYELTDTIQITIDSGYRVKAMDLIEDDLNLTDATDLLTINLDELDRSGQNVLVDPSAQVHPQAKLSRTIVGPKAKILTPAVITDSLIMPGATVAKADRLVSCIANEDRILHI